MPAISVIMPVYNSLEYLPVAIESVLNQTFNDFELLLIDDGSTDGSGLVCDRYGTVDNRIKVIHKTNGGMCGARNLGINIAQGEYIAFIDNDDYYEATLLEDNFKLAKKHNADVVKFGHIFIVEKNGKVIEKSEASYEEAAIITRNNLKSSLETYMCCRAWTTIWNAIYRKNFIVNNGLQFNTMHKFGHEDMEFNILMYPHINKLVINTGCYYNWIKRIGHSSSSKFDREKFESILHVLKLKKELFKNLNIDKKMQNKAYISELGYLNAYISHPKSDLNMKEKIEYLRRFEKIVGHIDLICDTNWKQKITVDLYNANKYKQLVFFKYLFNRIRKKEDY